MQSSQYVSLELRSEQTSQPLPLECDFWLCGKTALFKPVLWKEIISRNCGFLPTTFWAYTQAIKYLYLTHCCSETKPETNHWKAFEISHQHNLWIKRCLLVLCYESGSIFQMDKEWVIKPPPIFFSNRSHWIFSIITTVTCSIFLKCLINETYWKCKPGKCLYNCN